MKSRARFTLLAGLSTIAAGAVAQTQPQSVPGSTVYVAPEPTLREPPRYPGRAAAQAREGWVALSFIISATGDVREPMVEDSSGNADFERAARDAVAQWRYKPASVDGKPVEQSVTRSMIYFKLENLDDPGASDRFRRSFDEIQKLIVGQDLAKAKEMLDELQIAERVNLYEDAWFWWLKYVYLEAEGGGDRTAMQEALRRAIGYQEDLLPPDILVTAIQRLFVLQAQTGDLSAALETFERMQTSNTARGTPAYSSAVAALEPTVQRIRAVVDGETVLSLNAMIPVHGIWYHRLLRRAFSIGEIQGALDLMEIRCARRNVRYEEVAADLTWQIPVSWGACGVYVKGTAGAAFKLYELPVEGGATTQAPAAPPVQPSSDSVVPAIASGQDRDVVPLVRIPPDYPTRALRQKQCGWVKLAFEITEIGTVEDARVVEASDTVFGPAAVAALMRWRYNPKIEDGMRVRREGMQTVIRFALEDGKGPDCRY